MRWESWTHEHMNKIDNDEQKEMMDMVNMSKNENEKRWTRFKIRNGENVFKYEQEANEIT